MRQLFSPKFVPRLVPLFALLAFAAFVGVGGTGLEAAYAVPPASSCNSTDPVNHPACVGATATIGENSCNGWDACTDATGIIGHDSCNGTVVGFFGKLACAEAGAGGSSIVGNFSCNGYVACSQAGKNGGSSTVGDNSCNGSTACQGAGYNGSSTVGDNSCSLAAACSNVGAVGGSSIVGSNSCNGDFVCLGAGQQNGVSTVGDNSCTGHAACVFAGKEGSSSVGNYSCNGESACYEAGYEADPSIVGDCEQNLVDGPCDRDMTATKTHAGNFYRGQVGAEYAITATNIGTIPTDGQVTVVDTLPTGLTITAMSGSGWSCTPGTGTCTRTNGLAAGESATITVTVNVSTSADASLSNTATVSGGGEPNLASYTANNIATDPTTIDAPDLTVTKTHSGNFHLGQVGANYTITVKNNGSGPTVGLVTVVDTLPTGLTITAMSGSGWSCAPGAGTCTRSASLPAGATAPVITVTVNVSTSPSVTNVATVSGGSEANTGNDIATDPTTIDAPDLTVTKTHSGNFYRGQVGAKYTITVKNVGTYPTTAQVKVVDTLPPGLTATGMSGALWACSSSALTCTRSGPLAPGASSTITVTVNVSTSAGASVTNTATVSGGGEANTANDIATDLTTIDAPDLVVTKTHSGNFYRGQTGAKYQITVTNIGTAPAMGLVKVVDTLPAGLTAVAISGNGGWACMLATLTCTRNTVLAPGSSYPVITVTVNVASNAPAAVTNTVTVSGGGEANTANDTATDPTTITPVP